MGFLARGLRKLHLAYYLNGMILKSDFEPGRRPGVLACQ